MLLSIKNKTASARNNLDIKFIKDDVLCLRDGVYRAVMQSSTLNFELKSEAEQDQLLEAYQAFLNSLPLNIQIIVKTRQLDINDYLKKLDLKNNQQNLFYKKQKESYKQFISQLISDNKILSRKFYLVVCLELASGVSFENACQQLKLNCNLIAKNLARLDLYLIRLKTLELIDLFYEFYSPNRSKRQPFSEETLRLVYEAIY